MTKRQSLILKTYLSLQQMGVKKTSHRVIRYLLPRRWAAKDRQKFEAGILTLGSIEARFTEIYKANYWGSEESVSGYGSTLEFTANLRAKLPEMLGQFDIESVFDAPCGDFNWMRHFLEGHPLDYIGGDIVAPLIESHNARYRNERTRFIHIDLVTDKFPQADLMICRDCLIHLSFDDTKRLLENFVAAKIPYLLSTTYVNKHGAPNRDIATGDCRSIDLFSRPYNFPEDVAFRTEDPKSPEPHREVCLWTREQVEEALQRYGR